MSTNRFQQSLETLEANEAQAAVSPLPATTVGPTVPLLSDIVTKMPRKSRGVAHNIYLSKPVSDALTQEAKRRSMTKGKLVDEVLKRVLGVE